MQKRDLIPTYDVLCSTFCENSIGRNEELSYFISLLDSISGPYSIALDGRWGCGKTFFVKQAKMIMDVYNPHSQLVEWEVSDYREKIKPIWESLTKRYQRESWDPQTQLCIYFDAWEHDSEDDPILSLLYKIALVASSEYKFDGNRNATEIISNIIDLISGKRIKDLLQSLKEQNPTDSVKKNFDLKTQIDKYFSSLLPEHGNRLIIFIDELDRCVPSYTVKLLERIKHYFTNDKITFVFSLNMEQLQYTIKQHYGDGFNAHKYIERFFDLTIPMPKINHNRFYNYLSYDVDNNLIFKIANAFVKKNHMEMREITRYYAVLNTSTRISIDLYNQSKPRFFCFIFLFPIAVGLHKCDITKFHRFIDGDDPSPLTDLLNYEKVMNLVLNFFESKSESEAKQLIEAVYKAILIDAKEGKVNTIQHETYNEHTYNFFIKTLSLLEPTVYWTN